MGKHFCFVHCADLHLGAPFSGIMSGDKGPWTEAIGKATFKAFEIAVDLAIEKRADALIISGDVYNSSDHSLAAQMVFARELYRAAQAGIPAFIVHGNHDPSDAWRADIPLPPSTHVFAADKVEEIPLMKDGELAATVYGISYASQHVKDNLALQFIRKPHDGFAIGMLHTEVGVSGSPYAPCTLQDLQKADMDYWALGHVHTGRILNEKPFIIYPGNTQGLNITENGPRGCYFVDVGSYGTVTAKFFETDAVRWLDMKVDISEMKDQQELIREIMRRRAALKELTGRPNIVRIILQGRGVLHKAVSSEEGQEFILQSLNEKEQFRHIFSYFYEVEDRTQPELDLAERRYLPDIMGDYLRAYEAVAHMKPEEKKEMLKSIVSARPEMVRFAGSLPKISDEQMEEAFRKAEMAGAECLAEEDPDENH